MGRYLSSTTSGSDTQQDIYFITFFAYWFSNWPRNDQLRRRSIARAKNIKESITKYQRKPNKKGKHKTASLFAVSPFLHSESNEWNEILKEFHSRPSVHFWQDFSLFFRSDGDDGGGGVDSKWQIYCIIHLSAVACKAAMYNSFRLLQQASDHGLGCCHALEPPRERTLASTATSRLAQALLPLKTHPPTYYTICTLNNNNNNNKRAPCDAIWEEGGKEKGDEGRFRYFILPVYTFFFSTFLPAGERRRLWPWPSERPWDGALNLSASFPPTSTRSVAVPAAAFLWVVAPQQTPPPPPPLTPLKVFYMLAPNSMALQVFSFLSFFLSSSS